MLTRFLIISILLTTKCLAGFPTTPVLDTFTRANSTTTLGSNWTKDATLTDNLGILSNQAYTPAYSVGGMQFWNPSTFSGTMEVYDTETVLINNALPCGPVMMTGTSGDNGYQLESHNSHLTLTLYRWDNAAQTDLLDITQTMKANDGIGFSWDPSGLMIVWYRSGLNGQWVNLGSVIDTTYTPTYIGIWMRDTGQRLTNFGGGRQAFFPVLTVNGSLNAQGRLTVQ